MSDIINESEIALGEKFMLEAISLAESAKSHGNHPFGALLVVNGNVVLRAENTVITGKNSSHHAESNLMNLVAASQLSPDEIASATLFTSTEPCVMCSGAIYWGGVKRVVYGCPCEELARIANDDFFVPCREILSLPKKSPVLVEGPLCQNEAVAVHIGFWDLLNQH